MNKYPLMWLAIVLKEIKIDFKLILFKFSQYYSTLKVYPSNIIF